MSDYREALKRLSKDERTVVAHLEELIGEFKAVRVASVFKGQEAKIVAEIEAEFMAHVMPIFKAEINKEHTKIAANMETLNQQIAQYNRIRAELQKQIDEFQADLNILGHITALSTEGKVTVKLPTEEQLKQP